MPALAQTTSMPPHSHLDTVEHCAHMSGIAGVARHFQPAVRALGQRRLVHVGDEDPRAFCRKGLGHGLADARSATGDENTLAHRLVPHAGGFGQLRLGFAEGRDFRQHFAFRLAGAAGLERDMNRRSWLQVASSSSSAVRIIS
jgi:hypothetical protein